MIMSNIYICAANPESVASDDLVRAITVDPDGFCKDQTGQEEMPTYLAESINTAIALSDALEEYVNVSADYDIYPDVDAFFRIRVSNFRRADGDEQDLELPPSYSMLMAALVSYLDVATACVIDVPDLAEQFNRTHVFIPRRDVTTDAELVEISYDSGADDEVFDLTRALYLFHFDITGSRWSLTVAGSYDIETEKFMDGDSPVQVDEEVLDYAKSDDWYKHKDV